MTAVEEGALNGDCRSVVSVEGSCVDLETMDFTTGDSKLLKVNTIIFKLFLIAVPTLMMTQSAGALLCLLVSHLELTRILALQNL